ncbi:MAG: ATPase [Desulfurococcales archaeon]|nr:ATPase [Desulfurococcales archaeon]
MRVAMLSGGKDSLYAAFKSWPIDLGIMLIYDFPRPSPHLLNLGKSIETLLNTGIPVITAKLSRGKEWEETVNLLKKLGVDEVVAGDVYIEDHLRYMESIAKEVGASLREPLWGLDGKELMYEIFSEGFKVLMIGCDRRLRKWLGREIYISIIDSLIEHVKSLGMDPLGENGEYHTLVIDSPLHSSKIAYEVLRAREYGDYVIARVI